MKVSSRPQEIWTLCAEASKLKLPAAVQEIETVRTKVGVDFSPDTDRFPRAFTVHHSGTGLPFVSCPWRGELRDVLAISHEFGHALQLVLSAGKRMPPVTRELCACLSEFWNAEYSVSIGQRWAVQLSALLQMRTHLAVTRTGPKLIAALADAQAPYSYTWNYPPARALARISNDKLDDDETLSIFRATTPLKSLLGLLPVEAR